MSQIPQTSPVLSLPYIQPSQAQKHVTHNTALATLDVLVQAVVADRDQTQPPAPVAAGAVHLVAPGGQAEWAGQDLALAVFDGLAWSFLAPLPGWRVHVLAEGFDVVFDGTAWVAARTDPDNLDRLGIGTTADAANPLAVSGDATLLTHAGSGHQLKINKAATGDTASLLFQTGWSGRAEMGTSGSDDFAIKLSADGASWVTALSLDAAGLASGAAVQQAADDTATGRLARADWVYGPGNLLGNVSEAAGAPTGAVIERGTAGGGTFIRFADGTQICTETATLTQAAPNRLEFDWSYPRAFAAGLDIGLSALTDAEDFAASVTGPGLDEALSPCATQITRNGVTIQLYRVAGSTDFAAGDSTEVRLTAIGRWF